MPHPENKLTAANNSGRLAPDAPQETTFAQPCEEPITVSGPAWAEYHLLLRPPLDRFARIEREVRLAGGAPVVARLLAFWSGAPVVLRLTLGRDPNARLIRREIESWLPELRNLQLDWEEDEGAPEVPYRIWMWPQGASQVLPQVLQCGEIAGEYEIAHGACKYLQSVREQSGDEAGAAARTWAILSGLESRAEELEQGARRAWGEMGLEERWEERLGWEEVEAAGKRV